MNPKGIFSPNNAPAIIAGVLPVSIAEPPIDVLIETPKSNLRLRLTSSSGIAVRIDRITGKITAIATVFDIHILRKAVAAITSKISLSILPLE